jgi:hypothetical protein
MRVISLLILVTFILQLKLKNRQRATYSSIITYFVFDLNRDYKCIYQYQGCKPFTQERGSRFNRRSPHMSHISVIQRHSMCKVTLTWYTIHTKFQDIPKIKIFCSINGFGLITISFANFQTLLWWSTILFMRVISLLILVTFILQLLWKRWKVK